MDGKRAGTRRVRRVAGCVSIGAGTAAIVAAIALPTVVVPHYLRIPADIRADTLSIADNASLIDVKSTMAGRARTETGVPLRISVLVSTVGASTDRAVTMQGATRMYRADRSGPGATVSASVDKVTLDRYSSHPTGPVGLTSVDAGIVDTTPRQGYQYKLPFDTRRDGHYLYYDDIARVDVPLTYHDDDRSEGGMRLLHFRAEVPLTDLYPRQPDMETTLPASYWGLPGDDQIRMDLHYGAERDLWVEPLTGMVVEERAHLHRVLARGDLGPAADPAAVTTLDANTRFDDQSLSDTVDLARTAHTQILWGRIYGPALLAILGVLAILGGLWMLLRGKRAQAEGGESADVPPSSAPSEPFAGSGDPSSTDTSAGKTTVTPILG